MAIAEREYSSVEIDLKVRYEQDDEALYLTLMDGRKLTLVIPDDSAVNQLVALLVSRQNEIDANNYNAFANDVVRVSPAVQGLRDSEVMDLETD